MTPVGLVGAAFEVRVREEQAALNSSRNSNELGSQSEADDCLGRCLKIEEMRVKNLGFSDLGGIVRVRLDLIDERKRRA